MGVIDCEGRLGGGRLRLLAIAAIEVLVVLTLLMALWILFVRLLLSGTLYAGVDSRYYFDVAMRIVNGEMPYRDFVFEYPPLALVPVVLPLIVLSGRPDLAGYGVILVAENVALVVATAICLAWLARRGWSAVSVSRTVASYILLAIATPVLLWRFDAFPTLLAVLGLVAYAAGRTGAAGVALGAGTAAKVFPIFFLPILGVADLLRRDWARPIRMSAAFVLVIGLVALVVLPATGTGALLFLGYHAGRGVQLESVLASIGMVGELLGAAPAHVFNDFGSWQIDSPLIAALGWLGIFGAVIFAGLLMVSLVSRFRADIAAHGKVMPQTLVIHLLGAMLVLLLAYRVLSPQFLTWLLPLAALQPRREMWTMFAICVLSLCIYPIAYEQLVDLEPPAMLMLIARNLMLIGLFGLVIGPGVMGAIRARRTPPIETVTSREPESAPTPS